MKGPGDDGAGRSRTAGWIFAAILAAGVLLRLAALENRPLHGDEAAGASFSRDVARAGSFVYQFSNRHGPFQYFLGGAAMAAGGESPFWIRFPYALAGSLLPLALLPLRRRLTDPGWILSAGLLAFSPFFVYYSRYAIQEIDLAAATALFLGCGAALASGGGGLALAGFFVSGAWMVTVKETFVIVWGCIAGALVLGAVAGGGRFRSAVRTGARNAVRHSPAGAAGLLLGLLLVAGAYSDFFRDASGLGNLARNLLEMLAAGASSAGAAVLHRHPPSFYLSLLLRYEWLTLALFLAGTWSALRSRRPFALFLALYALLSAGIYLALPYKTPWLLLTPLLPMAILGGHGGAALLEIPGWKQRSPAPILMAAVIGLLPLPRTLILNFVRPADPIAEPIVYHQAGEEHVALAKEIQRILSIAPSEAPCRAVICLPYAWPLAWYLRDQPGVLYERSAIPSGPSESLAGIPVVVTLESGDRGFLQAFTGSPDVPPFSLPTHANRRYVLIPPDYAVARLWIRSDLASAAP